MNNTIGENIRKFRELRGYSQDYMAQEMNITQSAYGKIEKENVKITIERLVKIAEILEMDMANLINSKNQNIFNLYNNQTANGNVENLYHENKENIEKLLNAKDEIIQKQESEIQFLRKQLERK